MRGVCEKNGPVAELSTWHVGCLPACALRYSTVLLASVFTCLALAACGGGNDSAKSAADAQASADKANAATDKASDKADDAASDANKATNDSK